MTAHLLLAAQAAQPSAGAAFIANIFPLFLVFGIFYFLMIRPQVKRHKQHQAEIAALKKGDKVVTSGGLLAKVVKVGDTEVELDLGNNVRVKAVRSMIGQVLTDNVKPAND